MAETSRADLAKQLFLEGYNCAQSVAGAFTDLLGLSMEQTVRLVSGFGGGIGRLREVCGAACGAVFVLSAVYGYEDAKAFEEKKRLYEEIQKLAEEFRRENGYLRCGDLLGLNQSRKESAVPEKRTAEYYKKRPCPEIVYTAAQLLEEQLEQDGKL